MLTYRFTQVHNCIYSFSMGRIIWQSITGGMRVNVKSKAIPTDSHGIGGCEVLKIKSVLKDLKPY